VQLLFHVDIRRAVLALADQAAVSGTNFLTTVLLGRLCLKEELGLYALGFSLVMIFGGASKALMSTPYTFNSPRIRRTRLDVFTGSVTVHMALFCILMAVGLGIAAAVNAMWGGASEFSGLLAVLAIAGALMTFREYVRRVYLAQMRTGGALALNLGLAGLQMAGLAFVIRYGTLSARNAYVVIALACAVLIAVWLVLERRRMRIHWRSVRRDWRRNWRIGRWVFAASVVRLGATGVYPWLLAAFHGVPAVAILAAARGIICFANPFMIGMSNFAGPFAAHGWVTHGPRALWRRVVLGTLGVVAVIGAFCAVMFFWGAELLQLLYGPQYAGQGDVVRALALSQLVEAAGISVSSGLLAARRADYELTTALVELAVMVSLGIWLVWRFGPAGVGYGYAAAFFMANVVQWFAFRRIVCHV